MARRWASITAPRRLRSPPRRSRCPSGCRPRHRRMPWRHHSSPAGRLISQTPSPGRPSVQAAPSSAVRPRPSGSVQPVQACSSPLPACSTPRQPFTVQLQPQRMCPPALWMPLTSPVPSAPPYPRPLSPPLSSALYLQPDALSGNSILNPLSLPVIVPSVLKPTAFAVIVTLSSKLSLNLLSADHWKMVLYRLPHPGKPIPP